MWACERAKKFAEMQNESEQQVPCLKVVSFNVNGIRAFHQKLKESGSSWAAFFAKLEADIICLQEVKISEKALTDELLFVDGFETFYSCCKMKDGYSGVCTFAREGITLDAQDGLEECKEIGEEGRLMLTDHGSFVVMNLYFPNGGRGGDRLVFKHNFQNIIEGYCKKRVQEGKHIVLVGDLNIAHTDLDLWNPEDVENQSKSGLLPVERQWFTDFLGSGFVDVFRALNPSSIGQFTWWRPIPKVSREQNKGMRLDYTVVDKPFFENHVLSAGICKDIGGSDHCPIWLSLKNLPAMPTVSSPPPLSSKRRKRPKPQATLLSFWAAKPSPPAEERKEKEQEPPPSPPAQEEEERSKPSQVQEDSTPTPEEETVVPQPTVKAPMRTPTLTTNRATEKKKATPAKRKGLEDPKQKNLLAFFKKKEEPSQQKKKFKSAEGT